MKYFLSCTLSFFILIAFSGLRSIGGSEVKLVCMRKNNASNLCYYNFKVDGAKYHYIDTKCKSKRDDVVEKAKDGKIALAKDWKITCPGEDD